MGNGHDYSGTELPRQLFWASSDRVLTAELEHKQFRLGSVATGGSIKITLLLHNPNLALTKELASLFNPWESSDPIRFELFSQYDLLGKQTTRILNIYNTDGVFRGMGINSFLINTLIQYLRLFLQSDSLVVVSAAGEPEPSLGHFYRSFFNGQPDLHGDYIEQLSKLSYMNGLLFNRYDRCIPLSEFSTGTPPAPNPNSTANNF
jgi:hypothetical protein